MGNTIAVTVYLDYEVIDQREAVEAGESLTGKVVVEVKKTIDARNLYLELNGKEKSCVNAKSIISKAEQPFFRTTLQLYKHKDGEKIKPNNYVFPFEVPLPAKLPSSQISKESISQKGVFSIGYDLQLVKETTGKYYYKRDFSVVSAERIVEDLRPCLFQPDPFFVETKGLEGVGKIFLGGRVPDAYLLHGEPLQVAVACKNLSTCDIESINVILEEEYEWKTHSNKASARIKLVNKADVTDLLPRLRLNRIRQSQVEDAAIGDETIARRMFQELKDIENQLSFTTPKSSRESYNGSLIKISHFIKIVFVTSVKPDSGYPSIRLSIRIASKSYDTLRDPPSGHVSDKYEVKFPRATATNDCILTGKDAILTDTENEYGYGPTDEGPSLEILLKDLALSLDDYGFLAEKLKDIEWAIFFGSLAPKEFGAIIRNVDFGVIQTMVGVSIAKVFGGDFTCSHCVEAIDATSKVFRSNMAECLLPYCVDLSENNEAIRNQLSDFEQVVVALHALNVTKEEEDEYHLSQQSSRPSSRRPKVRASREEDGDPGLSGSVTPQTSDICMDDNEHPGTTEFLYIVRDTVEEGTFQQFAPPVYRRIRKRAKGWRFLIRPYEELPHYWRIASDREKIEYIGQCYDLDRENLRKVGQPIEDDWAGGEVDKGWQKNLIEGGNEWVLAMTVHSYASHIYDRDKADDRPAPMDICFRKKHHPGNEAMKEAIRNNQPNFNYMDWAPPVYKAIKAELRGRRYFVPLEQGGWKQATQLQRRTEMGNYYNAEKNARKLPHVVESSAQNNHGQGRRRSSTRRLSSSRSKPNSGRLHKNYRDRPKPREEDVCFGLADHSGTKSFQTAVIRCLSEFEKIPWSPPVYEAIKAQLGEDTRYFIRTEVDAPWKEANTKQRIERIRQQFELSRNKMRMKVGVEAMVT